MEGFDRINWKTKPDKSCILHLVIALVITLVVLFACRWLGKDWWFGWLLGSAIALAIFVGRENRDCENGLELPSGAPSALILMWIRPSNFYDLVGPLALFVLPGGYRLYTLLVA